MRFKEYLKEKSINKGATISFFDIDETILSTKALIYVMRDGKIRKKLSNQEFNTYELQKGESFDFSEFRDADLFKKTSIPIPMTVDILKNMFKRKNIKNQKVVFLTARSDFDDKEVFLSTFSNLGIPINDIYVERAGNIKTGTTSQKKEKVVKGYLDTGKYTIAKLFDDDIKNLQGFASLDDYYPDVRFISIQIIDSQGKMKMIK